jgi:ABC-type uncharacterized transport system ATPase subunit
VGIGRTYQVPRPFAQMTVFENVLVAAVHGARLSIPLARREAAEVLERTGLTHRSRLPAGDLGRLDMKQLELAKALAVRPRLLLLAWDIEPTAAEQFRKEVKIADDISHDVFGKLCATLTAKGMKSNVMETYFKEQLGLHIPYGPSDTMIYERFKKGDTARTIAERTLDAFNTKI